MSLGLVKSAQDLVASALALGFAATALLIAVPLVRAYAFYAPVRRIKGQ